MAEEKICDVCRDWTPATREQLDITLANAKRFGLDQIVEECPHCKSRDWAVTSKYFRNVPWGAMPPRSKV